MGAAGPRDTNSDRRAQSRAVVDEYLRRRAAGEKLSDEGILATYPELMPELADELRRSAQQAETLAHAAEASPSSAASRPAIPADTFPGYQVVRELSRGGQGVVWQAIQEHTNRKVAIKVLREGLYASRAARKRFEREIELVAQLKHPNIISIFHSGITQDGRQFYVMDYVRGLPLQRYVREHALTLEDALRLFITIVRAVHYAHEHGIIHRDLKPSNILVDTDGNARILDFGLAKWLAAPVDTVVSLSHDVLGTLPYAAPEQARGSVSQLDARTDVYSLGVVLYELLTGDFPYPVTGSMASILQNIAETPPAAPRRRWSSQAGISRRARQPLKSTHCPLDGEIQTIVLKALAKEPERRFQSAAELAEDLERYLQGQPVRARRDSVGYLAWAGLRAATRRQPLAMLLGCLVLIVLAAHHVVAPAVYKWSPLDRLYERLIAGLPTAADPAGFEHVRIIALTDDTDVGQLAQAAGLVGVSAAQPLSLRRLHGALMERLAASGLRTLGWNVTFGAESEYDDDLVRGILAVRRRGADVVVSTADWERDESGLPFLCSSIVPHVRWGAATADFAADRPWSLDLVVARDGGEPLPSFALGAVSAYRQPGADTSLFLDPLRGTLEVRYWEPARANPRARKRLGSDRFRLTGAWTLPEEGDFGLRRGDQIGHYYFTLPPDEALDRHTLGYEQVFRADEAQLRRWFRNRLVIVGDFRAHAPRYPHADGRTLAACHGQASAIEALLNTSSIRVPQNWHADLIVLAAALLGAGAAWWSGERRTRRILLLTLLTALVCAASVGTYLSYCYLWNPLVPVFALLAAATLASTVRRQAHAHGT